METRKIICDTDIIIDYLDIKKIRQQATVEIVQEIGLDNIMISAITVMELIAGAQNKQDLQQI